MDPRLFPKDFLWGASTSSHQVEGGNVNQWSEWELAHANDLARTSAKRLSWLPNWKTIKEHAQDPKNYVSGRAVDHYHRYEEDFDIVKKLHLNSFRFGIEWSRIEPQESAWNVKEIQHYHQYIDALNKRGITPMLNIWHWTMPTWFTDKGGFEKKANIVYFEQYVQKIIEEYGDKVRYVLTLNEPNVYAVTSYFTREWPPQEVSFVKCMKVIWNLAKAHKRVYGIIKSIDPTIKVGVAMSMRNEQPIGSRNPLGPLTAYLSAYGWNRWFLNRIKKQQDFIGINYYATDYFKGPFRHNPTTPLNDMGWYMEPEGILPLLVQIHSHYKKPIMIVENGLADGRDRYRKWWIESTLIAMQRAISQGVQLEGYFHWGLLDNFEWAHGWWPKFGLVEVDREHGMKRTIRPSALWFSNYLAKLRRFQTARAKAHGRVGQE